MLARIGTTLLLSALSFAAAGQQPQGPRVPPPGPMIDGGSFTLQTPDLHIDVLKYSGTVAKLTPTADAALDYTPGDRLKQRSANTFYHLGDLDLRYRKQGETAWTDESTAFHRQPVKIESQTATKVVADVTSSLTQGSPLKLTRTWAVEGNELVLRFTVTNTSGSSLELGGIGIAMVFNNIIEGRSLDQAYKTCSFYDPYIGEEAGYVQVSRLNGQGPVLLVMPDGRSPMEAWKPILDRRDRATGLGTLGNDPTPRGTTFEGSYDWMVHSSGFAETDWKGVEEWNKSTSQTLAAGASTSFGVRFAVAPGLRQIESTLTRLKRPVAVGVPGYILPQDMDGRLFLRYASPVRTIVSEPAGAVVVHDDGQLKSGLHAYTLRGKQWGRSRLVITYADGTMQTIAYRTIKPEPQALADMGHFLYNDQWFSDTSDPFHRAPGVISYDDSVHAKVLQDPRVWIAGLSDEAGAGSWLAAAVKEGVEPNQEEVAKLESFVDGVLWGHLQDSEGPHQYGVHKSLFFYQPALVPGYEYDPKINWKNWTSWDKKGADDVGRSYNYPHVIAAYWSLYRLARNTTGLTTKHPWDWYLNQAYETSVAMCTQAPYYTRFGNMEGTVIIHVLNNMKAEGWNDKAAKLEALMKRRADRWKVEEYPFGSEMPWDSTGQEEVYGWARYFGYNDKADVTLNAILAYTPVLPSWGYNGSARRYWDFVYGGKYTRIERQLHHYGSGLNAIPLLSEYRLHPDDLYLLRAGYGGVMGPLTNIDEKGFASAAFHSFPDRMAFDPYTGDYGPNFFGHAINTGTFLTHDDAMGWLCFGGNVSEKNGVVHFTVLDSSKSRIFIAPLGLWINAESGVFSSADYDTTHHTVRVHLIPATEHMTAARLHWEQTFTPGATQKWSLSASAKTEAGASVIALGKTETIVTLQQK